MYDDYVSLVLADYKRKSNSKELSLNLTVPKPANLRKQCLIVCRERYRRQDARTLKDFFGQGSDQTSFLQAIQHVDINKFKPLQNFLAGKTGNTEPKNIELLAWLIDYTDRPFELGKRYDLLEEESIISATVEGVPEVSTQHDLALPQLEEAQQEEVQDSSTGMESLLGLSGGTRSAEGRSMPRKKKTTLVLVTVFLLVGAGLGTYLFWPRPSIQVQHSRGVEQCMYWNGDHYERISCSQPVGESVMVIAFDSTRLGQLKMITQPDTITYRSIGSVWYIKSKGQLEYYTAGGMHPVNPQLRLKPITTYIIDKYIYAKTGASN